MTDEHVIFATWNNGEPNNGGDENYAHMFLDHAAKWNNMPGTYLIWAVAETEPANPELYAPNDFALSKGEYKKADLQGLAADDDGDLYRHRAFKHDARVSTTLANHNPGSTSETELPGDQLGDEGTFVEDGYKTMRCDLRDFSPNRTAVQSEWEIGTDILA